MTWPDTMTVILRSLINDLDDTCQMYSDARLQKLLVIAAQLLIFDADFIQPYVVNIPCVTISPDPTAQNGQDDAFINLTCLKAAAIMAANEYKAYSLGALKIKDGPSEIDSTAVANAFSKIAVMREKSYQDAKRQYQLGNSVASQAILTPYTVSYLPYSFAYFT